MKVDTTMIATLIVTVFIFLSGLHVYWAFGNLSASSAAVPQRAVVDRPGGKVRLTNAFRPTRATTLLVAVALFAMAIVVAMRAGLVFAAVSHGGLRAVIVLLAVVFLARAVGDFDLVGFFKQASASRFALFDTWLYSPLCVAIGLGLAHVAA